MSQEGPKLWERALMSAATALGFYLFAKFVNHRWYINDLQKELSQTQEELEHERTDRKAERTGRIRSNQELRELHLQLQQLKMQVQELQSFSTGQQQDDASNDMGTNMLKVNVYPLKPIGVIQSCFSTRNGTPRQPLLAPQARSRLQLAPDIPPACLEGLDQYSHCWILYIFHENTDLHQKLGVQQDRKGLKAKIHVPRLNGGKMGVLATRSPHRPVPVGLSVAKVVAVQGNSVILGGADIVDGSPVLDIKPYVPFCDSVPDAVAPPWVKAEAEDEPLQVASVHIGEDAANSITHAWAKHKNRGLYTDAEDFMGLIREVLSRDIRSLHKRLAGDAGVQSLQSARTTTTAVSAALHSSDSNTVNNGQSKSAWQQEVYQVILEGIDIWYKINDGVVTVVSANYPSGAGEKLVLG